MNSTDTVLRDEMEIDLGGLLWSVLSKWRTILAAALLFALLLGGFRALRLNRAFRAPGYAESAQEQYNDELADYQTQKQLLQSLLDAKQHELREVEQYIANSALYAIDPYHVFTAEAVYYIEAEPDAIAALSDAYAIAVERIDVAALFAEASGHAVAVESLRLHRGGDEALSSEASVYLSVLPSLLTVSTGEDSAVLEIFAIGADPAQAALLLSAAEAAIDSAQSDLARSIRPHDMKRLSESSYESFSRELAQFHVDLQKHFMLLLADLKTAKAEAEALTAPANPLPTRQVIIKSIVKNAVLGFVLGAFLAAASLSLVLIVRGTLLHADELMRRYHACVLGVCGAGARANRLDRRIARHRGIPAALDEDAQVRMTAANIAQLSAGCDSILLAGTPAKERIAALCERLAPQLPGISLKAAGNLCEDPESVLAFGGCEAVILVEELGASSFPEIERELLKVYKSGKKLPGFVLLGNVRG